MKRVAIHSVPRSGSSWLGQIFNSSPKTCFRFQPLFSYAFKDYLNAKSSQEDITTFFEQIAKSNDDFLLQRDKMENGEYPSFSKDKKFTHIVYKEVRYNNIIKNMLAKDKELVIIGLIRSPYAVVNSFLKSPREFRKDLGWNEVEEWQFADKKNLKRAEEFFGYYKWKEAAHIYLDLHDKWPHRVYLLRYEDLVASTRNCIQDVFQFCSIEYHNQTEDFINKSCTRHDESTLSVYKDKRVLDQWKHELPNNIVKEITADISGTRLEKFVSLPARA